MIPWFQRSICERCPSPLDQPASRQWNPRSSDESTGWVLSERRFRSSETTAIQANQFLCAAIPVRQRAETLCRLQDRYFRVLGVPPQSTSRHQFLSGTSSTAVLRTRLLRRATALQRQRHMSQPLRRKQAARPSHDGVQGYPRRPQCGSIRASPGQKRPFPFLYFRRSYFCQADSMNLRQPFRSASTLIIVLQFIVRNAKYFGDNLSEGPCVVFHSALISRRPSYRFQEFANRARLLSVESTRGCTEFLKFRQC